MKIQSEGSITLCVGDIRVTVSEMGSWSPARIGRFFRGLAMAVAAANNRLDQLAAAEIYQELRAVTFEQGKEPVTACHDQQA